MRKRTIAKRTKGLCLSDDTVTDLFNQMKGISDESTLEGNSNHQEWSMAVAKVQNQQKMIRPTKLGFWTNLACR